MNVLHIHVQSRIFFSLSWYGDISEPINAQTAPSFAGVAWYLNADTIIYNAYEYL
jgi:hypothetical protein